MPSGHLRELLLQLSENSVEFILCGGVAMVLQGAERMTLDLDISLHMEEKNALVFTFVDPEDPIKQVVFLTEDARFEDLISDTEAIHLENHMIHVLSRKKLLEMKRNIKPLREKDLYDIRILEKLLDKN